MATEFKLPELGEGVESADVARILVSAGDQLEADQNVMELETEKAVADLPCPHAGKVAEVHVSEGDTIHVGQTLLTIEGVEEAEAAEPEDDQPEQASAQQQERQSQDAPQQETAKQGTAKQETAEEETAEQETAKQETAEQEAEPATATAEETEPQKAEAPEDERQPADRPADGESAEEPSAEDADTEPQQKAAESKSQADADQPAGQGPAGAASGDDGRHKPPAAGPATRRLARKLDVDLDDFQPAEGDRIRMEDVVRAYVERGTAAAATSASLPDFTQFGSTEREPLNAITKTAARRLTAAWRSIPLVTQHGSADITELESARRQYLAQTDKGEAKITLTAIVLNTVAGLLKEFPKFNASLDVDNEELILKRYYHIGVAVDTDHGLLVPVIRDVDRKTIQQLAAELSAVADQARRRQLGREDFEGGTFSVSNQGGIGGGTFTPIVNFPEVAILGLGRARGELRMIDGEPSERLMLPLSLSYDHRVINGADAARFMERLSTMLANEFALLVAT